MTRANPVVDDALDVLGESKKLRVRVYPPSRLEGNTWACRLTLGAPFGIDRLSYGEGPLQALVLGLNIVAANLYSCDLWKSGRLGWRGVFGGYLGVAAPTIYLDFAPYPFDLGDPDQRRDVIAEAGAAPESPHLVLEETFAVSQPHSPLQVRLFVPDRSEDQRWRCRVQIDAPIEVDRYAAGASGLEALWRALCLIGEEFYGSPLWRAGKLGTPDDPGGFLGVPPPTSLAFLTRHSF